jgi:hypothetical protein
LHRRRPDESEVEGLLAEAPDSNPMTPGYLGYQLASFGLHPADYRVPDNAHEWCSDAAFAGPCRRAGVPYSGEPGDINTVCSQTTDCFVGLYCEAVEGLGYCAPIWDYE